MVKYSLNCSIQTVPDDWAEYVDGYAGGPPIKEMESRFGAKWKPELRDTQLFLRRKAVYDDVTVLALS
ncbi:hypothetical protein M427DRAFT_99632 [Gonapodya prolifera JEL478]|uniref:Transcription activator GCR1-like domain-containing protein n=1 Tax=Gonapodya prolifera (strain JEL478) TaxID=1344416 RepID=A0A139ACD5_GONPJ|nr:hypothetical protein M427DRAFT_99632 [Gonapodya prolifera JEL478]|eukprot:KXS14476.1 hypothetical protein M427DRAFT_99632 [Gonapodya prolifera JEL478]